MIATKSLAKAFSYDAALIPREVLELAVKPVTVKVTAIFQLCTGDRPTIPELSLASELPQPTAGAATALRENTCKPTQPITQPGPRLITAWFLSSTVMGGSDAQWQGKLVDLVHSSAYSLQG